MNLNAPRFIPGSGIASRLMAALDAENPTLNARVQARSSPPATVRHYSHQSVQSEPPPRVKIQSFTLPPPAISSIFHPPKPITTPPTLLVAPGPANSPNGTVPRASATASRDAERALAQARREREKAEHSRLPAYHSAEVIETINFSKPKVVYSRDPERVNELVKALDGPLGFDAEWKPQFIKGRTENRIATIQICDTKTVIVAQVFAMKVFPEELKKVLQNPDVIKCGLNISGDGDKMFRDYGIVAKNLVELGRLASQADASVTFRPTLAFLVGHYLGRCLEKGNVRTSNWELPLTAVQVRYASDDAYCGLQLYERLKDLATQSKRKLDPHGYTVNITRPPRPEDFETPVASSSGTLASEPPLAQATAATHASSRGSVPRYIFGTATSQDVIDLTSSSPPRAASPVSATPSATPSAEDSDNTSKAYVRPSQMRAYKLWHQTGMGLDSMCGALRSPINPLKRTTVITYVVEAVRSDPTLPYRRDALITLINTEPWTCNRYRDFAASLAAS